ncbi:DUF2254 domain-containing protein [Paenibacillus sp. TRM 82003]|nr:DUF2254 domain-containing protein [Paenibacillus sp. TRM 82003]
MTFIQALYFRMKKSFWFTPGCFSLAAGALALLVDYMDSHQAMRWLPPLLLTKVDLAISILTALTTSLLTMTTVTFSIIMVVLTTYTSQFSPRTLSSFIRDKVAQRIQGVFLGGFVYSILSLFLLKHSYEEELVFSATLGVVLSIFCLSYFIHFIHHVATSIQVNHLAVQLADQAIDLAKRIAQERAEPRLAEREEALRPNADADLVVVAAGKHGYVQYIDSHGLVKLGDEVELRLLLLPRIGGFVAADTPLFQIRPMAGAPLRLDSLERRLRDLVTLGSDRTAAQDISYSIERLAEIALRAISPGINDPNTAIYIIRELGRVLSEVVRICDTGMIHYAGRAGPIRLTVDVPNIEEVLYKTFYQICHYGRADISVMCAILEALAWIAERNEENVRKQVRTFGDYVYDAIDRTRLHRLDTRFVREKLEQLNVAVDRLGS